MHTFSIQLPIPFDFTYIARYLSSPKQPMVYQIDGDTVYRALPTAFFSATVDAISRQVEVSVEARIADQEAAKEDVRRFIMDWWDLSRDMAPFYQIADADALLSPLAAQHRGLRIVGIPDLFECFAWTILGQQVNTTFASTLKQRIIEHYGHQLEWQGIALWEFPTPGTIAALSPEELRPLAVSQRKAEYLIGVAQLMEAGSLSKEKLSRYENAPEAAKALTQIRGVGVWTANYVLLRCLRFSDAYPVGDVALQNTLKQLLGLNTKPDAEALWEIAKPWKGWEAYATYYLWYAN